MMLMMETCIHLDCIILWIREVVYNNLFIDVN